MTRLVLSFLLMIGACGHVLAVSTPTICPTPQGFPDFAVGASATYTVPSAGKQSAGWASAEKPPYQTFNWLHRTTAQNIREHDNRLQRQDGHIATVDAWANTAAAAIAAQAVSYTALADEMRLVTRTVHGALSISYTGSVSVVLPEYVTAITVYAWSGGGTGADGAIGGVHGGIGGAGGGGGGFFYGVVKVTGGAYLTLTVGTDYPDFGNSIQITSNGAPVLYGMGGANGGAGDPYLYPLGHPGVGGYFFYDSPARVGGLMAPGCTGGYGGMYSGCTPGTGGAAGARALQGFGALVFGQGGAGGAGGTCENNGWGGLAGQGGCIFVNY